MPHSTAPLPVLVIGALPVFISGARFSGDAFRLFRWRSPQSRMQMYLETVLAREDNIKEVKLFGLKGLFLQRYRAYMRENADILVLDEPTAAMDPAAEAEVFARFREHSRNKMTILISHRFSTIRSAEQILVVDAGRIIERGTHAELLAQNGRYAALFRLQARGYQ